MNKNEKVDKLIEKAESFKAMVSNDKAWSFFVSAVKRNIEARKKEKLDIDISTALLLKDEKKLARLAAIDIEIKTLLFVIDIPSRVIRAEETINQRKKEEKDATD